MIKKLLHKAFSIFYSHWDRNGFVRWIGVNIGTDLHIYGNPLKMFGSEPWLVTLGDHVHITLDVLFLTHDGGTLLFRDKIPDLEITAPITIGNNVFIGARSIILPGTRIGNNCIIAAGSVVAGVISDDSVVGGIPAKHIKSTQEYLKSAMERSLHLGHLRGKIKDIELRKHFKR